MRARYRGLRNQLGQARRRDDRARRRERGREAWTCWWTLRRWWEGAQSVDAEQEGRDRSKQCARRRLRHSNHGRAGVMWSGLCRDRAWWPCCAIPASWYCWHWTRDLTSLGSGVHSEQWHLQCPRLHLWLGLPYLGFRGRRRVVRLTAPIALAEERRIADGGRGLR